MTWDPKQRPEQAGKVFVVTGGNAGIGYFISEQLASTGAKVILASNNQRQVEAAIAAIRTRVPGADLDSVSFDLSDLSMIRSAAEKLNGLDRVDGLIANAGRIGRKTRSLTKDGFEVSFGNNHLGHFALLAQAYPVLARTPGSRVVTISSTLYRKATLDFDDLQSERSYQRFHTYAKSKLANLLFAIEFDRRLRAADRPVLSLAAHPGGGHDALTRTIPGVLEHRPLDFFKGALYAPVMTSNEKAAWPAVRAALDPEATGGQLYGPRFAFYGKPVVEQISPNALDEVAAKRLWTKSVELTGVEFEV